MTEVQATAIGTLYLVATPIGNLEDITLRALKVLKSVDRIFAEDTRHSLQLLTTLGIKNQLSALHAHNEGEKSQQVITLLLQGQSVALISDAGTPLICDPGFPLVHQARQHNIPVVPIPGPCALITALCASGIPCDSFSFYGFLPAKQGARRAKLETIASNNAHTLIFYESTHRILDCLQDISALFGCDFELVLAKELTKTHERFICGTVATVQNWLLADPGHVKGEFVILIPQSPKASDLKAEEEVLRVLLKELPLKQAVSLACELTQANKNVLYDMALKLKKFYK